MSDINKIAELVEQSNRAFAEFRQLNDKRLADLEKGRGEDPLVKAALEKANADISRIEGEISAERKAREAAELARNASKGDDDGKMLAAFRASGGRAETAEQVRAYRTAFNAYLRRGDAIAADIKASMSVGSDPDGGYLVNPEYASELVKRVYETSPIRQLASVVTISSDRLKGVADNSDANADWVGETGTRSASTTPTLGAYEIPVHESYSFPLVSQQLLDDAGVNVEAWLAEKTADKLARLENTAFVSGNGVNRPRGFTSYTTAATADSSRAWGQLEHVKTGTNGSFGTAPNGSDKLIDLVHKMKAQYRNGSAFVMNKLTLGAVRQLKANSEYIWLPSMDAAAPSKLLGFPVVEAEDMADYTTTDALAIAFGNFKIGYQIVDRIGVRVLRDPFSNKPYVGFYTTKRVGGAVVHFEAIKFLKFSA